VVSKIAYTFVARAVVVKVMRNGRSPLELVMPLPLLERRIIICWDWCWMIDYHVELCNSMLGQESRKAREAMHVVSRKYRGLDVEVWIVGE
jgi:hypothetical protein